jgi:hypothetical protein
LVFVFSPFFPRAASAAVVCSATERLKLLTSLLQLLPSLQKYLKDISEEKTTKPGNPRPT